VEDPVTVLGVVLLVLAVLATVARPPRVPRPVVPVACALVGLASGADRWAVVAPALRSLGPPLAFLLTAVPLAVLLDDAGLFRALADLAQRHGRRDGVLGHLWLLAAGVTALLNLDAAVVLLTPLYVAFARSQDLDPFAVGVQPALLALLASSALPVSNLTNLIAAGRLGLTTGGFLLHLGLPTLAATAVGYASYRRRFGRSSRPPARCDRRPAAVAVQRGASARPGDGAGRDPRVQARPGGRGIAAVGGLTAAVVVGFSLGGYIGVAPFEVAMAADVVLALSRRRLPWRAAPLDAALLAASLGVLTAGVVPATVLVRLLGGSGVPDLARDVGLAAIAANLANNLPTLLLLLGGLGHRPSWAAWAVLLGVNAGPLLVLSGSLSTLLWAATMRRLGVRPTEGDFVGAGVAVVLPGLLAGLGCLLLVRLLVPS
jgi:arsenical pump membrane protein